MLSFFFSAQKMKHDAIQIVASCFSVNSSFDCGHGFPPFGFHLIGESGYCYFHFKYINFQI